MKPALWLAGSHRWASPSRPQSSTLPVGNRCTWIPTTGVVINGPQRPWVAYEFGPEGPKVAGMVRAATTVWEQVPVPEHGLSQPEKTKPGAGVAVSVTTVEAGYLAEQPVAAGVPLVIAQSMAGVSPA